MAGARLREKNGTIHLVLAGKSERVAGTPPVGETHGDPWIGYQTVGGWAAELYALDEGRWLVTVWADVDYGFGEQREATHHLRQPDGRWQTVRVRPRGGRSVDRIESPSRRRGRGG